LIGLILPAVIVINLAFWIGLFSRLIWYRPLYKPNYLHDRSLDIIVVFKNAKDSIVKLIPLLLNQKYKSLLVKAVDDYSSDGTDWSKTDFKDSPLFERSTATEDLPGKKAALQEAIDHSKADIILLTDADCLPASQKWASLMAQNLGAEKKIVLGYSPVTKRKSLLNKFIRYEAWLTAVQYLSYALAGIPYMGVGRNLCYDRSLVEGFHHDLNIHSGDDDLMVSALADRQNVAICINPEAYVYTEAKSSIIAYINQKARHMTTAPEYKMVHRVLLALFAGSQMMIYPVALWLLFCHLASTTSVMISLSTYIVIKMILSFMLLRKLKENDLIYWVPLLDILLSAYYMIMSIRILVPYKGW